MDCYSNTVEASKRSASELSNTQLKIKQINVNQVLKTSHTYPGLLDMTGHVSFPESSPMHALKSATASPQVTYSSRLHRYQLRRLSLVNTTITRSVASETTALAIHASTSSVAIIWAEFAKDFCVRNEAALFVFLVVLGINQGRSLASVLETG